MVCELRRIGSLEKQHRRVRGRELRMQTRVVEGVVRMAPEPSRPFPRSQRFVCFRIPELAQCRRFAEAFHEYCHPALSKTIPSDVPGMCLHYFLIGCGNKLFLRL